MTGVPSVGRQVTRGIRNVPKERSLPNVRSLPKGTPKIKPGKMKLSTSSLLSKGKKKKQY